jgi:hypothetical protein
VPLDEILVIALPVIAPYDTLQCRIGFRRRRIDGDGLPRYQSFAGQYPDESPEDGLVVSSQYNLRVREIVE